MHRQFGHGRLEDNYVRRAAARNSNQRLGDRYCGRGRLLSHIRSGRLGDQRRERSVLNETSRRHHA